MDRYLLLNHPLVWRAKPATAFLVGVLAWSGCGLIGHSAPTTPGAVWAQSQIGIVQWSVLVFVATACVFWGRQQLRYPCVEQSWSGRALVFAINFAVLLSILLSVDFFSATVSRRVASSIPEAIFQEHFTFHEQRDFWICSRRITRESLERDLPELEEKLRVFGLETDGVIDREEVLRQRNDNSIFNCGSNTTSVVIRQQFGESYNFSFRDQLLSIKKQQQVQAMHGFSAAVSRIFFTILLATLGALTLSLASMPNTQLQRVRRAIGIRKIDTSFNFRMPEAIRAYERRLLLNDPTGWAMQAHRLALRMVLLVLSLAFLWNLFGLSQSNDVLAAAVLMVIFVHAFWVFRRFKIFPAPITGPRHLVRLGLVVLLYSFPPLAVVVIFNARDTSANDSMTTFLFAALFTWTPMLTASFLANSFPGVGGFFAWVLGTAAGGLLLAFKSDADMVFRYLWLAVAIWLWLLRNVLPGALQRFNTMVSILLLVTTQAFILTWVGSLNNTVINSEYVQLVLLALLEISAQFIFAYGAQAILLQHRYVPRRT